MGMKNLARRELGDIDVEIDPRVGRVLLDQVALLLGGDAGMVAIPRTTSEAKASMLNVTPGANAPRGSWVSVSKAATVLGFGVVSLRRLIERNARRAADGGTEASVDGVHARKVGRTWRVLLSDAWTSPSAAPARGRVVHEQRGSARHGGSKRTL